MRSRPGSARFVALAGAWVLLVVGAWGPDRANGATVPAAPLAPAPDRPSDRPITLAQVERPAVEPLLDVPAGHDDTLDVALEECVAAALRSGEEILQAQTARRTARARYLQARSTALPQLSFSGTYTRQLESIFQSGGGGEELELFEPDTLAPFEDRIRALEDALPASGFVAIQQLLSSSSFASENSWVAALGLTQRILQGGSIIASIQGAKHVLKAADLSLADQRAQITMEVRSAYLDALLAERGVRIGRLGLEQAETQLRRVRLRQEAGQASEFELLGAEVQRDNAVPPLRQAELLREIADEELRRLCNLPVGRPLRLVTPFYREEPSISAAIVDTAGLVEAALENSGIRALENLFDARGHAVTVARAGYWPDISAFANLSHQAFPDDPFPKRGDWVRDKNVGVAVTWTLFDGFYTQGAVEEAQANRTNARVDLLQARELARLAVVQQIWDLQRAAAEMAARGRTVQLANRALDLANLRYEEGASDALEVQDARIAWQLALTNEAQARRDYFRALAQLERYTGRPLFTEAAPPGPVGR